MFEDAQELCSKETYDNVGHIADDMGSDGQRLWMMSKGVRVHQMELKQGLDAPYLMKAMMKINLVSQLIVKFGVRV